MAFTKDAHSQQPINGWSETVHDQNAVTDTLVGQTEETKEYDQQSNSGSKKIFAGFGRWSCRVEIKNGVVRKVALNGAD